MNLEKRTDPGAKARGSVGYDDILHILLAKAHEWPVIYIFGDGIVEDIVDTVRDFNGDMLKIDRKSVV